MTILTGALSAIGLMTRAEHEAASFRVQCQAAEALTEIEQLKAELRAADNLASGWEAKFKPAATDLAKQAEEIAVLKSDVSELQGHLFDVRHDLGVSRLEADTLRPDAQKWRNSLKRSRDRRAAKKTAPARDKRAKNRGGK